MDAAEDIIASVASGEWMHLTVNAQKTASYRAILQYGTPLMAPTHGI